MSIYQQPSRVAYVGNGATRQFAVPFPYIDRTHVFTLVNGVNAAFSWVNASLIEFAVAPVAGASILVYRKTPSGQALVDFESGAALQDEDLDIAFRQAVYIAREAEDRLDLTLQTDNFNNFNAGGRRVTNVGAPADLSDAVTRKYVEDRIDSLTSSGPLPVTTVSNTPSLLLDVNKAQGDVKGAFGLAGSWAFYEVGALFPGIYPWQNANGDNSPITRAFIRETIKVHADLGIDTLVLITGVEKFGWFIYPPSFPYWFDEQANRQASFWTTASPPGWIPTGDTLRWMYDCCAEFGMKLVAGTGKNGDDWLALDLALPGATVSSRTSAALAAKSKAARTTQAITRACQIGQDLWVLYGDHPAFGGFYIAHEPDSIDACAALISGITTTGAGGFPGLASYGVPVWISPGDIDDFPAANASRAAIDAKAATLRSWNVTHNVPQDAVGTGENINNIPTWNPANRLSMLRGYFQQWADLTDAANEAWQSRDSAIIRGANLELFQMDGPDYDNAYPCAFTRVQEQIRRVADTCDVVGYYGVFPYAMPSNLSLRLPQTFSGKTDFRSRSAALHAGLLLIRRQYLRRRASLLAAPPPRVWRIEDNTSRVAAANATTTQRVGTFYPQQEASRALIRLQLWLSRPFQSGLNSTGVTINPTINGIAQTSQGGPWGSSGALEAGPVAMEFEIAHDSFGFDVGWSITVPSGEPAVTVHHAKATVMEIKR